MLYVKFYFFMFQSLIKHEQNQPKVTCLGIDHLELFSENSIWVMLLSSVLMELR